LYLIGATAVSYALQIYMDVIVGPDPVLHGIVLVVFNVGSNLLQLFLLLGICRVMLRVARGEPVTIGDALSGGRYLVRAFLASIIFNVGMLLIAAVFVGPGVFLIVAGGPRPVPLIVLCLGAIAAFVVTVWLWLMFFFNLYCLVDRDAGAIESLRQARELSSGNMLHLLVLVLAWLGLSVAGYCMCLFGLFFTVPLMFLSQAVAYVAMRERR
jgi:uncharacterized membrane protein